MNASPGNSRGKAGRFLRVNGSLIFASELQRRCGVLLRRAFLHRKLKCSGLILGPGCHLRGLSYIRLGRNFQAAEGLWLEAINAETTVDSTIRICIGDNVAVSRWSHIAATHRVEIGDGVLIGSRVIITDHNHGRYDGPHTHPGLPPLARPLDVDKHVFIGRNVWLGDGVVVTPGSEIGEGSIIGANSVVIGTVPPFTIAAGAPAKPIKQFEFTTGEWVRIK